MLIRITNFFESDQLLAPNIGSCEPAFTPKYSCKIQTQDQPEFPRNLQSFADCLIKMSSRCNFVIDLGSTRYKLSSDYSLNISLLVLFCLY